MMSTMPYSEVSEHIREMISSRERVVVSWWRILASSMSPGRVTGWRTRIAFFSSFCAIRSPADSRVSCSGFTSWS